MNYFLGNLVKGLELLGFVFEGYLLWVVQIGVCVLGYLYIFVCFRII